MSKLESLIGDFEKALLRLSEALQSQDKSDIVRDSAIKRFEIVFDLAWKALKTFLEEYCNAVCHSPRSCFQEAFRQGLIGYDDFWLEVCKERNYAVHIYKEKLAEELYKTLPETQKHFQVLLDNLKKKL